MAVVHEFQRALSSQNSLAALRLAAERELNAGAPRQHVTAQLEELRADLQRAGRREDEDVVLEVMDFVTGWCSPHMRL